MRFILLAIFAALTTITSAQKKILKSVDKTITAADAAAHLSFLAADEMRGRNTGSPEIDIAANYMAAQFRILGVKAHATLPDYFQTVELNKLLPPEKAELMIGNTALKYKDDFLFINGAGVSIENEMIFLGYGTTEDFEKTDVKGKIAVTYLGTPEGKNTGGQEKYTRAETRGATALIEIVNIPALPWPAVINRFASNRIILHEAQPRKLTHLLMRNQEIESIKALIETKKGMAKLTIVTKDTRPVKSRNVIGIIEGSDPKLRNEWIAVTAHYDHVGVRKNSTPDSIYNGARDNAIGTVALLEAARFFGSHQPKRSILLVAFTAEEVGMLGSKWYADHPVIPLKETVFNFNCDGGGYNDKSLVTIIDFNRTTADELLKKACASQGLTLGGDPAPEQNLYERSDNLNFALKGIPSVNISPGVKSFDQEVLKHYHQPSDEVNTLDMEYLGKFYRSFVYALYLLGSDDNRPAWKAGDKFEAAGKTLYSK